MPYVPCITAAYLLCFVVGLIPNIESLYSRRKSPGLGLGLGASHYTHSCGRCCYFRRCFFCLRGGIYHRALWIQHYGGNATMATDVGCMRVVMLVVMVAKIWPMCRSMTLVGKGLGPWMTRPSNCGGVHRGIRGSGISSRCNGLVYKCRQESFIDSKTLLRGVKTDREVVAHCIN